MFEVTKRYTNSSTSVVIKKMKCPLKDLLKQSTNFLLTNTYIDLKRIYASKSIERITKQSITL